MAPSVADPHHARDAASRSSSRSSRMRTLSTRRSMASRRRSRVAGEVDTPDPSEVQWQHGMQELTAPLKDWEADFQARHSENLHHHGTEGTRIGVCFDGSPQSDRAFEIACRFLRPQSHIKDSLHVIHIVDITAGESSSRSAAVSKALGMVHHCEALARKYRAHGHVRFLCPESSATESKTSVIMRLASDLDLDMLVVAAQGSKSSRGASTEHISSTARTLIRDAPCSVCLVRPSGLAIEEHCRWVCATDATAPSEVAFAAMLTTMCRTGDKAEAWLVVHDPKSVPPPPAPPPIPEAPDPKKGRVGRGPSSKMPATQPPPVSPQQEPVDLSKPLHPYAATLHSLKSGGKLKRAVARIFHIPGDSHVPHLSPSALGGHSLDASTAPALLGQRALDYAVDFVVIPETFHIEKPPEPPTPPPPPPPPPVQESKGRPASGKGGRPGSARQGAARPSSGRGTGVEVKEVLAGGTPAPEVRRPRPKPPAKGEVSDQAWEAVQSCRVTVVVFKDPRRRRERSVLGKGKMKVEPIRSALRLVSDEASFPVPRRPASGRMETSSRPSHGLEVIKRHFGENRASAGISV